MAQAGSSVDLGGEIAVDGDDDVGIPHQHLLDRDIAEAAAGCAGDVPGQELDPLTVIEPPNPVSRPRGPRAKYNSRPLILRDAGDPAGDGLGERVFGLASEDFRVVAAADQLSEQPVGPCRPLEAAVEHAQQMPHPPPHAAASNTGVGDIADVSSRSGLRVSMASRSAIAQAAKICLDLRAVADVRQQATPLLVLVGAQVQLEQQLGRQSTA